MLLETMIEKIKEDFPSLKFSVNKEEHLISIPAFNEDVGGIQIQDDEYELTVYIGHFTHWHVGDFEETNNEKEKAINIANEISEFLNDLFENKIIMWGKHEKSGGFYHIDEKSNSKSLLGKQHEEWTWSGPISSS